jgi:Mn2+/Fe2+ NRAMP family transporter
MQFINTTPPLLMVFSQAFQALILPAVAVPILILINRKSVMNEYTASTKMNIGLVGVVLFSLFTAYLAVADFFKTN